MAAPKQQFAYCCTHITAYFWRRVDNPCDRRINTRNTIIALFIMLALLLPLQAAAETALQPAQAPSSAVNMTAAVPVTTKTNAELITQKIAGTTALELAAAVPGQSATTANEDITTNAATTLAAVTGDGYVKIANSGQPLDEKADRWECVEDKSSKFTWEVKKNDGGIRDKDYSYSWFRDINGENRGVSNGGRCNGGIKCDTYSYVRAMNEQKLCGYSDWRLPTREEMETLVDYNSTPENATINTTYFPEAVPSWYWTATENPRRDNFAWYVLFRNGIALNDLKERPKHIRLVRGNRTQ